MTKALISLLLAIPAVFRVAGQPVNGPSPENLNIGVFYGKIIDAGTQKGIEGATVQLVQNRHDSISGKKREIILATQLSDKKGEFNIDNLPVAGNFRLRVSSIGYKSFDTKVFFDLNGNKSNDLTSTAIKDLGNFKLFTDAAQLEAITVNSNKPLLQMYLDKKVYNVEKDLAATGGTTLDILKNIPGVLVDMDGNVNIRNASPQIFIDGRPTTLSLDQIPSDQIASIELMTNPSAKYDAGGAGGILNIILKKNRRSGYNGNLRAGIDSRYKPGLGGDINIKQNKINFFAAAQFNMRKSIAAVTSNRTDYPQNATAIISQHNRPVSNSYFGFGRAGIDLLLTNRTTLSVSGNYTKGNFKVKDVLHIYKDSIYIAGTVSESAVRILNADIDFNNAGAGIGMKHNFAEAGKEWTADVNFNRNHNHNTSDYFSRLFDAAGNEKPHTGAERATGGGSTKFYIAQTDFVNPITAKTKFETGARAVYREYGSWNDNFRQAPPSVTYISLPATAVQFNFSDVVYAAYGTYSQQIKKFSYQVGVRLERSEYKGFLISKNERFSNEYPISFFPSLNLSQAINDRQELQFNYSRKVNRPGFFQLLPFVDFSDSLNLSIGNPDLKPEFTQLAELSFNNNFNKQHAVFVTAYGKYSEQLLTRYQYKAPNTDPAKTDSVIYNSFANASESYTYGVEITGKNKVAGWWNITSNVNFFNVMLKAANIKGAGDQQLFSWFAKLNNSFKIPGKFTLQLTGEYQAKTILPAVSGRNSTGGFGGGMYGFTQNLSQGYIKPIYGIDIALRREFFKNNTASVTLQVNDILRSRTYETHAESGFFTQNNYRLRDPQVFRLNFNWRFGKFDAALFKRKNTRSDLENLQMQQGGGQ
ncbi:MAG: TonB-dependent receptor [Rhizobacter sp.]|nr:TonB-dependent receptor [Ferruginibacter sp.]